MKKLFVLLSVLVVSSCAAFSSIQETAVDRLVIVAEEYCINTNQAYRDQLRADFNARFGGTVVITCPE